MLPRPRENNKSVIFSWLGEKLASSWRKCSYTAQQEWLLFVMFSLANTEYYNLTQSALFALQISQFVGHQGKKDQFHLI